MGSSQSKFKPDPIDVWYRIKVSASQPKFLQSVLQAIVNLKEPQGSSQGRIIDYIQGVINAKQIRPRPRNIAMQVKSALKYALRNGLIKQHGGKFVVALTEKEYAIFKGFRAENPIKEDIKTRKRKSKSKRSRTRSRRRSKGTSQCSENDDCSYGVKPKKRKKYHQFDYESDESSDFDLLSIPSTSSSVESIKKSDSYIKKKRERMNQDINDDSKLGTTSNSIQNSTKRDDSKVVASGSNVPVPKTGTSEESSTESKHEGGGSSNKEK